MKLIGVQLDTVWEDKAATFDRVRRLLSASKPPPDSLLVLPEMFSTGFSLNVAGIQEGSKRAAEQFMESIAREYGICVLGGVVNLGPDGRGRNQALAYSPQGREIVRYDKMQPFTLGEEGKHYTAGNSIKHFDWQGVTIAPFVCYDLRFPELFRSAMKPTAGGPRAQLFVVIANWPYPRELHWTALLQARAIENQAYVIGVNRSGVDPKYKYFGRSMVIDPHGKILVDAGNSEKVISADIDSTTVDAWRRDFPALADMK
jgi:predicted amidohydrolase